MQDAQASVRWSSGEGGRRYAMRKGLGRSAAFGVSFCQSWGGKEVERSFVTCERRKRSQNRKRRKTKGQERGASGQQKSPFITGRKVGKEKGGTRKSKTTPRLRELNSSRDHPNKRETTKGGGKRKEGGKLIQEKWASLFFGLLGLGRITGKRKVISNWEPCEDGVLKCSSEETPGGGVGRGNSGLLCWRELCAKEK